MGVVGPCGLAQYRLVLCQGSCPYEKSKSYRNVLFSGNVLLGTPSEGAQ